MCKKGYIIDIFLSEIGCQSFIANSISVYLIKLSLLPEKKWKYILQIEAASILLCEVKPTKPCYS